jgi:hypothetical protein
VPYAESAAHRFATYGSTLFFENIIRNSLISILPMLIVISGLRLSKIWPIILITIIILIQVVEGDRILLLTISFAIYYGLYRIRRYKIPLLIMSLVSISGLFVLVTVGHSRSGADSRENVTNFIARIENIELSSYNPQLIGEFYMPAYSIIEALEEKEMGTRPFLIIEDIATLVPRAFYQGRPLSPAERRMNILYPEYFEQGRGYAFNNVTYGYWWLGYVGLVVYGLMYGSVLKSIFILIKDYRYFGTLLYMVLFIEIFNFARGVSIVGFIKNSILINLIPIILGLCIYKYFFRLVLNKRRLKS